MKTGYGLSVVSSIEGICIFFLALRTHGELGHGGFGAVIREVLNDCHPGAAIGTIYKGVFVPVVCGCEKFILAVLADGDIG